MRYGRRLCRQWNISIRGITRTAEDFAEACDPYLDEKGEFEEIEKTAVLGNTDKTTGDEYGGVIMVGAYENGKLQFTIGFNEEMEMVQFYIR